MLSQHLEQFLLLALAIDVALLVGMRILWVRLAESKRKWKYLLGNVDHANLERLLYDHLEKRLEEAEKLESMVARLEKVEKKVEASKRFVGVVRYNAFDDVAGNQSFSLAMYDEVGNGAVISSLVGRSACRVYCKELKGGRSDTSLSKEEREAIDQAVPSKTGAFVSP